jgi:hypothetical protein
MPTGDFVVFPHNGAGTDATGARTARDATDVAGASSPDIDATGTAGANTLGQTLCLRRFVSRPLAAVTFAAADGNWTFSYARGESNTSHNGQIRCCIYAWRPSTGLQVGTRFVECDGTAMAATAETADSVNGVWSGTQAILDGDVLVFEVNDVFTQGMSSAYTTFFSYNGTTEASTTTCASFVTPPAALTLFTAAAATSDTAIFQRASGRRRTLLRM